MGERESGGEKRRTREKEGEKRAQAKEGGGEGVGSDDGEAFNAGRGCKTACEGDLLPYCMHEFG